MKTFTHELAISAVPYDRLLVDELSRRISERLQAPPIWREPAQSEPATDAGRHTTALLRKDARLALVLHQRLWRHDDATRADVQALRQRVHDDAASVRVVTLDAEPLPEWLAALPHCSLGAVGIDGVAAFAVDAVVACGGSALPAVTPKPSVAPWTWTDSSRPYLTQSRAVTALRREFEELGATLERHVRSPKVPEARPIASLHCAPHRITAQLDGVGLSFSWLPGRDGTVADGRLMVIEWAGTVTAKPGMGAVQTARPVRERSYRAECTGPGTWRWRAEDAEGVRYTTEVLAAQWLAGASLDAQAIPSPEPAPPEEPVLQPAPRVASGTRTGYVPRQRQRALRGDKS